MNHTYFNRYIRYKSEEFNKRKKFDVKDIKAATSVEQEALHILAHCPLCIGDNHFCDKEECKQDEYYIMLQKALDELAVYRKWYFGKYLEEMMEENIDG